MVRRGTVDQLRRHMATERLTTNEDDSWATTATPGVDRPTLQRSQSAKKKRNKHDEVLLSTSLSAPGQSTAALYRHLRQHRNSWPTIEAAAATAAAKAIKRTCVRCKNTRTFRRTSFPYFNGTGICTSTELIKSAGPHCSFIIRSVYTLPIRTYAEPVPLKYGKLAISP